MKQRPENRKDEGLGKDRLEAFSDGVFAIAITLLVLDLRVPHLTGPHVGQMLPRALLALWPQAFSYALSFVIIGVYWVAHHLMLHALARADRTLLWLNNLFLLFVAAIPFSASLLGAYPRQPVAVAVYGLNLVLTSGSLQLWWLYATERRRLLQPAVTARYVRLASTRTLSTVGVYAAAVGIAFVFPGLSVALYWLAPLSYILVQSHVDRRAEVQAGAASNKDREEP